MKNAIRLAMLCLATASVPALAQGTLPRCGSTNFDQARGAFTVKNPAPGIVNQQCLITVYPKGAMPAEARQDPASYLVEGTYAIELVGGGGGGGGGSRARGGGGGGGAGAAISRTTQFLAPGDYKLTLGTGGEGGAAGGGRTGSGNPTSLTNASTGQLIAGFPGADVATARTEAATGGAGGVGMPGGSGGGAGGFGTTPAQPGGVSQSPGPSGMPGQAGAENVPRRDAAGGGGGASLGSGGAGQSEERGAPAGAGQRGGHGQIKLTLAKPAPDRIAAAPAAAAPAYVAPAETQAAPVLRPKKDRN